MNSCMLSELHALFKNEFVYVQNIFHGIEIKTHFEQVSYITTIP